MRIIYILDLLVYFVLQLLLSNLKVLAYVWTGFPRRKPSMVACPMKLKSPYAITVLAQLVTLTPGTLSVDVSSDRKSLTVHSLFSETIEGFEWRVRKAFE